MKKLFKKGFTIVELIVVIAVIAIFVGVLIPTFSGIIDKANKSAALQTARNTLSSALNMSSSAALPGHTADGIMKTVFCVNGYAFDYNANSLEAVDYPNKTNVLKHGATATNSNNFNSILIASENLSLVEDSTNKYEVKNVAETIYSGKDVMATDLKSLSVTLVDNHYYVNYVVPEDTNDAAWDAEIYVNSDFSNKVVVFTTFSA